MCKYCRDKDVQRHVEEVQDACKRIVEDNSMDLYGKFFAMMTGAVCVVLAAAAAANVQREREGAEPAPIEAMSREIMDLMMLKIEASFSGVDQSAMNEEAKAQAAARMASGKFH